MMNKPNKIIIMLIAAMFAIVGIYTIITGSPHEEGRSYNVSLIYRNPSDSFKLGAEQAAEDLNVDIHLISGYEIGLSMQQKEYIQREVNNGAQAIILAADDEAIYEQTSGILKHISVIAVGEPSNNSAVTCYVGADNYNIGVQLGMLVSSEDKDMRCVILCPLTNKTCTSERLEGIRSVLDQEGRKYDIVYCNSGGKEIAAEVNGTDTCILMTLDKSLLEVMCRAAREGDILFGEGYTGSVRTQLETGRLEGIIVYSEYNAGYLSVLSAVNAIENNNHTEGYILELYKVNHDNMYEHPGEKILFPIK
jgi:ribose transport system substrate-binding protein